MTDRVRSLTVILDREMRDDDAEDIAKLLRSVRHVQDVKLGPVVDVNVYGAKQAVYREIWEKIREMFLGENGLLR